MMVARRISFLVVVATKPFFNKLTVGEGVEMYEMRVWDSFNGAFAPMMSYKTGDMQHATRHSEHSWIKLNTIRLH